MTKKSKKLTVLSLCIAFIVSLFLAMTFTSVHTTKAFAQTQNDLKISSLSYSEETASEETADYQIYEDKLGYAIDVLNATSYLDTKTGNMVLDYNALMGLTKTTQSYVYSTSKNVSTIDINEASSYFQISLGLGGNINFFEDLKVKLEAGIANRESYFVNNYRYYCMFYDNVYKLKSFIPNYNVPAIYEDLYSTYYLNDLALVASGDMSYGDFFAKYGTHLIGEAYFGGKYFLNYVATSTTVEIAWDVEANLELGAETEIPDIAQVGADLTTGLEAHWGMGTNTLNLQTSMLVSAYGGSHSGSLSGTDYEQKYQDWRDSLDEEDAIYEMIGFTSNGLVALWDILPSEYSGLASDMEQAFEELAQTSEAEFIDDYRADNYIMFAGGFGTEERPYQVSSPMHLQNIEFAQLDAYYEQTADIDLSSISQWTAIGGHYKEKAFTGHYDGNLYSICNLNRTDDITETNERIYFGLFGYIGPGAVVEHMVLENVNIQMIGPAVNNSQTRVFVGALAGMAEGCSLNDIVIDIGTVSYNCNTNGVSHVGGVVGLARNANILGVTNYATVYSKRYGGVAGGIAGYSYNSDFTDCTNFASVSAQAGWGGDGYAGGIVGAAYNGTGYETTTLRCENEGTLSASRYVGLGGTFKTSDMIGHTINKNYQ